MFVVEEAPKGWRDAAGRFHSYTPPGLQGYVPHGPLNRGMAIEGLGATEHPAHKWIVGAAGVGVAFGVLWLIMAQLEA